MSRHGVAYGGLPAYSLRAHGLCDSASFIPSVQEITSKTDLHVLPLRTRSPERTYDLFSRLVCLRRRVVLLVSDALYRRVALGLLLPLRALRIARTRHAHDGLFLRPVKP